MNIAFVLNLSAHVPSPIPTMSPFNYFFCAITRASPVAILILRWRERDPIKQSTASNGINGCVAMHVRNVVNSENRAYDCIHISRFTFGMQARRASRANRNANEFDSASILSAYDGNIWPTPKSHFSAFTCDIALAPIL